MSETLLRKTPKDFVCPQCQYRIDWETPVVGHPQQQRQNGDIIVCGRCARTLQIRDDKLHAMTKREIANLPKQLREILKMTLIAVIQNQANGGDN